MLSRRLGGLIGCIVGASLVLAISPAWAGGGGDMRVANHAEAYVQQGESYQAIFEDIWGKVNEHFYDPNFAGVNWREVRDRYRPQVMAIQDDAAFLALMTRMLRELPVSHLGVRPPVGEQRFNIPLNWRRIDGQLIVSAGALPSDAYRQGLRPGDLILTPPENLRGVLGSATNIQVRGCDGRERTAQVRIGRFLSTPLAPRVSWSIYEQQPGQRIGYLRVAEFADGVVPLIDTAMSELGETSALIIDVRDNPGGNASFIRLASYFLSGQNLVAALMMRPALERFHRAPDQIDPTTLPRATRTYTTAEVFRALRSNNGAVALYSEDLGNRVYRGRVVVLINDYTGSAAEGFAGFMKARTRATLIGSTTAGQLLGGQPINVRGGWSLVIPTHAAWGPDGRPTIDRPTTPHIEVPLTREDMCDRRDAVYLRALDFLEQGSGRQN